MSGRSRHGAGLSDVVHSADEAPAEAVGGRSRRPDRDRNRDQFSLILGETSRKPTVRTQFSDCDPRQSAYHFVLSSRASPALTRSAKDRTAIFLMI